MKKNVNIGYLVFLSFVAALGGFLFGYDTAVISGTIAQVTVLFHKLYLQPIITQYFIDNKSEIWLLFLIAHSKR